MPHPARHTVVLDHADARRPPAVRSPRRAQEWAGDLAEQVDAGVSLVSDALRSECARRADEAAEVDPAHAALWRSVARQVGGRLMRPRLVLAAYLGAGGPDVEAVVPVAAAIELLHTAMLIHDDLLDHDETRRGRPNVAGAARAAWTARGHTGTSVDEQVRAAAVLGGDLALAAAFDLVASAPLPAEDRLAVVRLTARGIDLTVAGELLDVTGQLLAPSDVDARRVAELKTAVYSCCTPLAVGALLAGADPQTRARLDRYGTALGLAYQLLDDELGVFGDPTRTGKSASSDLREGKRTELLRLAYLRAQPADRALLDRHVGDAHLDASSAALVREVLVRSGALDELRRTRARAVDDARRWCDLPRMPALSDYLVVLAEKLSTTGA